MTEPQTIAPDLPGCPRIGCGKQPKHDMTKAKNSSTGEWHRVTCDCRGYGGGGETRAEAEANWRKHCERWGK